MVQIEATVNPRVRTASSPAHSPHPSAAVDSPPCPHSALPTWPKHTRASFFSPGLALSAGPASPPPLQAGQASRAAGGVCRPPSDWADIQGGAGSGRGQEAPARSSVQPWERGPLNNNQTAWLTPDPEEGGAQPHSIPGPVASEQCQPRAPSGGQAAAERFTCVFSEEREMTAAHCRDEKPGAEHSHGMPAPGNSWAGEVSRT